MTDRILALVDGSIYSDSVCRHAAWIAVRLQASVDVLHVMDRAEPSRHQTGAAQNLSGTLALGARSALLADLAAADERRARPAQARGRAILEEARSLLQQDGIGAIRAHLRQGDILEAVQGAAPQSGRAAGGSATGAPEAGRAGFGAIVIGKRGQAADFAAGHLGSNLERIVRAARVPVLVASRAFRPIGRALVAFDASPSATRAIARLAESPVFAGLRITLLHAGTPGEAVTAQIEDAILALRAGGLDAGLRIEPGEPETVLDRVVEAEGVDLLVMGAYGHSRLRNLIIGSTTTAMVRSVKVPVLIYR